MKLNLKHFNAIIVGYFITYVVGFRNIIEGKYFSNTFMFLTLMNVILIYLLLSSFKKLDYFKLEKIGLIPLFILTIILHIFTWIFGRILGPSLITVSEHPSILPLEVPNQLLVKLNLILIPCLYLLSLLIEIIIKNMSKRTYKKYLYFTLMLISLYIFNFIFLSGLNVALMLIFWN